MRKASTNRELKAAWSRARSAGGYRSPIVASEIGTIAPAPRPWMPRKTISCHMSWLRPHSAEPARKMATPTNRTARRPNRSDSEPHAGIVTVIVSR